MRIIPAIDIINGKCVRLTKGDFTTQKIYNENPLEVAKEFEASGIKNLHLVDLDGARSGGIVNHKILEAITTQTKLKVDFGGGIKKNTDVKIAFENGANQITVGSIAVADEELVFSWLKMFGSEKIILGADCLDRKIAVNGWLESSSLDVTEFIAKYIANGIQSCICTDISKDGMLAGPSINLYKEILSKNSIDLIASGGVTSIDDLKILKEIGCEGAIIGKAIYENRISLSELQNLC